MRSRIGRHPRRACGRRQCDSGVAGGSGVSPTPPSTAPAPPAPPAPAPPPTNPGASPNILLIIADDLGFDSSAQYSDGGTPSPATPTLDMLATNGLVFDNLWVNPTCSPTRATILTGRYALRTGVFQPGNPLSLTETSLHAFLTGNSPGTVRTWLLWEVASIRQCGRQQRYTEPVWYQPFRRNDGRRCRRLF